MFPLGGKKTEGQLTIFLNLSFQRNLTKKSTLKEGQTGMDGEGLDVLGWGGGGGLQPPHPKNLLFHSSFLSECRVLLYIYI